MTKTEREEHAELGMWTETKRLGEGRREWEGEGGAIHGQINGQVC